MPLGLVLSGGGALGAFEAGVVAAMEDRGLSPDVVSGTSAGAINAAGVACGFSAGRLEALWTSMTDRDVYRMRRDFWRLLRPWGLFSQGSLSERILRSIGWTWLWEWEPLQATLERIFEGERLDVDGGPPLIVSTVDVTSGELLRFASAEAPRPRDDLVVTDLTIDHLIASAAIPLLFRPGRLDGDAFWDGGIVANTPLAPALSWRLDAVVVVTTTTLQRPAPEPRTLAEVSTLLVDTVRRFTLQADLDTVEEINRHVRAHPGETDRTEVDVLLIEPEGLDLGDGLHFDPDHAARLFAVGQDYGGRALDAWDRTASDDLTEDEVG
jgi:NTE family protein